MFVTAQRVAVMLSFTTLLLASGQAKLSAQSARAVAASTRITGQINPVQVERLQGHVPTWATADNDQGALDLNKQLTNMHLILTRAPQVEAAFQQLLADQQNPASPRYHQWLTPQQNAEQFGLAPADLAAVKNWLQSQGLAVDDVAAGGVFITFSGSVMAVQNAFATTLHSFNHKGVSQYAPANEPGVPVALSGIVASVAGLSENMRYIHSHRQPVAGDFAANAATGNVHPYTTYGSSTHYLAPGDFNIIYDVKAAHTAGLTGIGYRVGVIIDATVSSSDIAAYQSLFGLPSNQPVTSLVPNNKTPAASTAEEGEADLDVQRVLGTAPGATVDLLVINSLSDSNIFSALQYVFSQNDDALVTMSFGGCNVSSGGKTEAAQYDSYYQTLASVGISVFNSSGDSGAAGCDGGSLPSSQVQAANILCMSSYVTCVGGTQFNDTSSNWSTTNTTTSKASALGYISEGGWNEPSTTSSQGSVTYNAAASGGGPGLLSKPAWQTGTGVPKDGLRDTPDVAFTASDHNGFLICQADAGNSCTSISDFSFIVGGTSAAAPSMAAITLLLDQKLGARQGTLNPLLYSLASGSSSPFHDITVASSGASNCTASTPSVCNNTTPSSKSLSGGLTGFLVGAGYDEVTGLGSLDAYNFITLAGAVATISMSSTPSSLTLVDGTNSGNTGIVSVLSKNNFSGTVELGCGLVPTNGGTTTTPPTCSLSSTNLTLTAGSTDTVVVTVTTQAPVASCTASLATPAPPALGAERGVALAGLLLVLLPFRKHRSVRTLLAVFFCVVGLTWLTGCASGTTTSTAAKACTQTYQGGTTKGTYTAIVYGISGALTSGTSFSVVVQ